jgi:hypothetical protein
MTGDALGAWTIESAEFPSTGTGVDKAGDAIPASSDHSTQSRKFPMIVDELLLITDRSQTLPVVDPFVGEQVICCAAALFKLRPVGLRLGAVEMITFPKVADLIAHVTSQAARAS